MFTGIVEGVGKVVDVGQQHQIQTLIIQYNDLFSDLQLGESIAVNGVCLTVTAFAPQTFTVECVPETLRRTNLGQLTINDDVNLERALLPTTRMGGHFVQGHVDATTKIMDIKQEGDAWMVSFELPKTLKAYLVEKGFITIDGMSLTVVDVNDTQFRITFIPHTQKATVVKDYTVGRLVNVEADILAKYIQEQYLCKKS